MANGAHKQSLLSDRAILRHIDEGSIVIEPFSRANLSTSSYDVTLGPFYFRETNPEAGHGTFINSRRIAF